MKKLIWIVQLTNKDRAFKSYRFEGSIEQAVAEAELTLDKLVPALAAKPKLKDEPCESEDFFGFRLTHNAEGLSIKLSKQYTTAKTNATAKTS